MPIQSGWRLAVISLGCMWLLSEGQLGFPQTTAGCTLAGTVINSATSAGVARALVSYSGPASGYRFTDAGGFFRIENLPQGQYSLNISKPGFISGQELSSTARRFAKIRALEATEAVSEHEWRAPSQTYVAVELKPDSAPARIKLVPVSSIRGTVLDENSEPLLGVSVQAIAVKASLSGTEYAPVGTASTDDRGRYVFLNLSPGDYVVRLAGEVSSTRYYIGRIEPNTDHRGLRPVYYPNGDSTATASVLHLAPGEQTNADFQQRTEAAFDINGRLSGFVPQAWTRIQMYREGDRLPVARAFLNLSTGLFRVTDIPPGSYTLRAVQYRADPPEWSAAEVPVNIVSEPIRNLVVELSKGVDIPVSVSYEAGAKVGGFLNLTLEPQHTRNNVRHLMIGRKARRQPRNQQLPGSAQVETEPEQPSVLTNVIPDKYRLSVLTSSSDYAASARLGEFDVLNQEFPVGGSVSGEIHLVIRGDSATVEGQVTAKGQPAPGANVYLIPSAGGEAGVKSGIGDESGHYLIAGVPPGDYRIAAWTGPPMAAELLAGSGATLTLQPSEHRTLALEATPNGDWSKKQE